jgi:photosystem II stability/assembly factor-like uncharacterized protein
MLSLSSLVAAVCDRPACSPRRYSLCALAIALPLAPLLHSAEASDPAPLAAKTLLLDIARAGDRLVAVGAFGNVVISTDEGRSWTQVVVPARALLTGVSFPDAQHGWAVGHDGVILATSDSGRTWTRQDSGGDLETVYLDVLFTDAQRGYAVGAYGKFLLTADGGKTWTPVRPAEDEVHYNRISRLSDGRLLLAGEAGTLLVSSDQGRNWNRIDLPYDGSLFGVVDFPGALVVCGLRGHILVSADHGEEWEEKGGAVPVLLMAGIWLKHARTLVLAGQGGNFLLSRDGGRGFTPWKPDDLGASVADLIETADGKLLVVGEAGATRLDLPPRAETP